MDKTTKGELSLQKQFEYEALRRAVRLAGDMETLRARALEVVDAMEAQQAQVMRMLRQGWLGERG